MNVDKGAGTRGGCRGRRLHHAGACCGACMQLFVPAACASLLSARGWCIACCSLQLLLADSRVEHCISTPRHASAHRCPCRCSRCRRGREETTTLAGPGLSHTHDHDHQAPAIDRLWAPRAAPAGQLQPAGKPSSSPSSWKQTYCMPLAPALLW